MYLVQINMTGAGKNERHIFSIGHSDHSLENFLNLLSDYHIEVLVDVRSHPYSKFVSHFNMKAIKEGLKKAGIKYLHLGQELGGRPNGKEFYDTEGYVLYFRVAESPSFLRGIKRLENGIKKYRVAIMCSEEDPSGCHRRLLVGRVLADMGIVLDHIRGDGRLQTEEEITKNEMSRHNDERQARLFEEPGEIKWKSIQSVLLRGQRPSSSER